MRRATDRTSFDLEALVTGKPLSLFIIVPPTKLLSHRPVVRLWLGTLILALAPRNGRMAEAYARLLGDVAPETVMGLARDEQLLLLEGGRSFRARRINYLHDPLCAGLFDPHPGRPFSKEGFE